MGSHRVRHDWSDLACMHALEKEMAPTPVFLPGDSQGQRSLMGCSLWGRAESDTVKWLSSNSSLPSDCQVGKAFEKYSKRLEGRYRIKSRLFLSFLSLYSWWHLWQGSHSLLTPTFITQPSTSPRDSNSHRKTQFLDSGHTTPFYLIPPALG